MKELVLQGARTYGPYALIAALVPGGSLIVLFLWLYRRYSPAASATSLRSSLRSLTATLR